MLGISKVMTLTCTYDHRIIQGAESGRSWAECSAAGRRRTASTKRSSTHLRMPHQPVQLGETGSRATRHGSSDTVGRSHKEAAFTADQRLSRARPPDRELDPLGSNAADAPELDPATYGLTIWDLDRAR